MSHFRFAFICSRAWVCELVLICMSGMNCLSSPWFLWGSWVCVPGTRWPLFQVIETDPEPAHSVLEENYRELQLQISANVNFASYQCHVSDIHFKETLVYQTRVFEWVIKSLPTLLRKFFHPIIPSLLHQTFIQCPRQQGPGITWVHPRVYVGSLKHSDPQNYSSSLRTSKYTSRNAEYQEGGMSGNRPVNHPHHHLGTILAPTPSPATQVTAQIVSTLMGIGAPLSLEAPWPTEANVSHNHSMAIASKTPAGDMPSYKSHCSRRTPVLGLPSGYSWVPPRPVSKQVTNQLQSCLMI